MKCRYHPDREAAVKCDKMDVGYCGECLDRCEACTDPCGYCKFRNRCIIWEHCKRSDKKNRPERIKGVLFDFDGTLTMPGALDFPGIKKEMGCPPDLPILEYLETLSPEAKTPLLEILEAKEEEAARESLPNQGAEACLKALKQKGLSIGIITRNSLRSVKKAFANFNAVDSRLFAAIITRDDCRPKPHPDGVHQAARRMEISPQDLLVVGDFRFDIIAGYEAGAWTVLLTNGKEPLVAPGDPQPDYTVRFLEDLRLIVDSINLDGFVKSPKNAEMSLRAKRGNLETP